MVYEEYGYCIIPKGTKLYRSGSVNSDNCMFFGLNTDTAKAFDNSGKIQVWIAKKDFKVLFMVLEIDRFAKAKSAIVEIYQKYYPNDNQADDLDIKHFHHHKRDRLIGKLRREKIIGWVSSVENKIDLELCLFPDKFEKIIELNDVIENSDSRYDMENALGKIEIKPSEQFYMRTKEKLENSPFEEYKRSIAVDNTNDRNDHINLRTKLQI